MNWKNAIAAGLGVVLFQEFVVPMLPASVTTLGGGAVTKYGAPIVGAGLGVWVAGKVL